MTNLTVGVVGLGVGEQHLKSYMAIPDCRVKSICDIDAEKLGSVGSKYNIENRFSDYRKITEDKEIDVVSICTYDDVHAEQVISALEHKKHVMVEKPLAVTAGQADDLAKAYIKSGCLISSNLILRRSPRFMEIKERIKSGSFGKLYYLEGDYIHNVSEKIVNGWRGRISFYSPIFGGGIHLIDLVRWLAEEEVVDVAAMGGRKATRGTGYPFDDMNVVLLRFAGGTLAKVCVTLTPTYPFFHALRVFGDKGAFENRHEDGIVYTSDQSDSKESIVSAYPGYQKGDLLPEFIEAIREKRQPPVSDRDVFNVMDVCLAAQRSCETGAFEKVRYRLT